MWMTDRQSGTNLGLAALAPMVALPLALALDGGQAQRAATPTAQPAGEKLTVSFSDPTRPGTLKIGLVAGSITVKGYDGKDVVVSVRVREDGEDEDESEDPEENERNDKRGGLRRIPNTASGVTVEEENNEMRVGASIANRNIDLVVQVPVRTSLKLSTVNDGDISVQHVEGEIEVTNTNGGVRLTDVAGAVVAHALNDDVTVSLRQVSGQPMSFSSLNGDIDVSLPPDIKANVRIETAMGDVYSDFDIDMQPSSVQQTVEDNRAKGGKYKVKLEKAMVGKINGGGPEIKFKNFNGDVHIRKAK